MITIDPFKAIAGDMPQERGAHSSEFEQIKQAVSAALSQAEYSVSTEACKPSDVYLEEWALGMSRQSDTRMIVAYFRPRSPETQEAEFKAFTHVVQQMNGASEFTPTRLGTLHGEINHVPIEISPIALNQA